MDTKFSVTESPSLDIFCSSLPTREFELQQIFEEHPSLKKIISSESFTDDMLFSRDEIIRVCSLETLNTPEYMILVFFCCSVFFETNHPLREWAASTDGKSFFCETLRGFRNKETKEQICVRALSLVGLGNLWSYSSDLSSKNLFMDFGQLVESGGLNALSDWNKDNKQDVFMHMAASLYRIIGEDCDKRLSYYFEMMKPVPLSPSPDAEDKTDTASDLYWKFRLEGRDHTHAWKLGKEVLGR